MAQSTSAGGGAGDGACGGCGGVGDGESGGCGAVGDDACGEGWGGGGWGVLGRALATGVYTGVVDACMTRVVMRVAEGGAGYGDTYDGWVLGQ